MSEHVDFDDLLRDIGLSLERKDYDLALSEIVQLEDAVMGCMAEVSGE